MRQSCIRASYGDAGVIAIVLNSQNVTRKQRETAGDARLWFREIMTVISSAHFGGTLFGPGPWYCAQYAVWNGFAVANGTPSFSRCGNTLVHHSS